MDDTALQSGTTIFDGKYRVEKVLGQGGFGITYLATQVNLNRRVAIKEFFLRTYCTRTPGRQSVRSSLARNNALVRKYCEKFFREARTIAEMEHPNIVPIYDVFEDNGTAYYVMKYIDGYSLDDIIKEHGPLPVERAADYISQIAHALDYVHKNNTLHLDIKPSNIMICEDKAILIDFGVSKHYDRAGGQTSSTPVGFSTGYAPIEQSSGDIKTFTPATDIYSLAATLYKMLLGVVPPTAGEIYENGLPDIDNKFSYGLREAIRKGMAVNKYDRPQSIAAFLGVLNEEPHVDLVVEGDEDEVEYDIELESAEQLVQSVKPLSQNRRVNMVFVIIIVVLIVIASFMFFINVF